MRTLVASKVVGAETLAVTFNQELRQMERLIRSRQRVRRTEVAWLNAMLAVAEAVIDYNEWAQDALDLGQTHHEGRPIVLMDPLLVFLNEVAKLARRLGLDEAKSVEFYRDAYAAGEVDSAGAAAFLGCSERHVRRLAERGHIAARLGPTGSWRCTTQSILKYGLRRRRA